MIKVRSGMTKIERKPDDLSLKRSYGLSIAKERLKEFSRVRSLAIAFSPSKEANELTESWIAVIWTLRAFYPKGYHVLFDNAPLYPEQKGLTRKMLGSTLPYASLSMKASFKSLLWRSNACRGLRGSFIRAISWVIRRARFNVWVSIFPDSRL